MDIKVGDRFEYVSKGFGSNPKLMGLVVTVLRSRFGGGGWMCSGSDGKTRWLGQLANPDVWRPVEEPAFEVNVGDRFEYVGKNPAPAHAGVWVVRSLMGDGVAWLQNESHGGRMGTRVHPTSWRRVGTPPAVNMDKVRQGLGVVVSAPKAVVSAATITTNEWLEAQQVCAPAEMRLTPDEMKRCKEVLAAMKCPKDCTPAKPCMGNFCPGTKERATALLMKDRNDEFLLAAVAKRFGGGATGVAYEPSLSGLGALSCGLMGPQRWR